MRRWGLSYGHAFLISLSEGMYESLNDQAVLSGGTVCSSSSAVSVCVFIAYVLGDPQMSLVHSSVYALLYLCLSGIGGGCAGV